MIRCSECERFHKVGLRNVFTGNEKIFWECRSYCGRLWSRIPKTHPRWCPKYKEVKRHDENRPVYADTTVKGSIFWMP